MSIKKAGEQFFVEVSSHQRVFGASGFKTVVTNLATGESTVLGIDGTEEIEQIDSPATATTAAAASAGEKTITLSDGGSLTDGMVFDDGAGNKYYIEELNGNVIKLKTPLVADVDAGTTLTQVGNTGIYSFPITINTAGIYGIRISNPSINMRTKELQVEVLDVNLQDIYNILEQQSQTINSKLDSIQNGLDNQSSSDFEVYSS